MEFRVSHEVRFEIAIEASSQREAEAVAADTPYGEWEEKYVVREDCIAVAESPVNPQAGG